MNNMGGFNNRNYFNESKIVNESELKELSKKAKLRRLAAALISVGVIVLVCVIIYNAFSAVAMKNFLFFILGPGFMMLGLFHSIRALKKASFFLYAHNNVQEFEGHPPKLIRMFLYKYLIVVFLSIVLTTTIFIYALIPLLIFFVYFFTRIYQMWKYHKLPCRRLFLPTIGTLVFAVLMANPVQMFLLFLFNFLYVALWKF